METLRCYICVYAATLVRAIIAWHRLSYILNIGNGPWIARNTPVATFRIKVYQGVSQFMKSRDNWTLKQNTVSHHHRSVCSISSVAMKQQYMIWIEYNQHDSETMTLHAGEYVTGVHPMHMQRPTPRQLLCHIPSHLSINGKMKEWNEMFEWSCLTLRLTYPATTKYPGPKTGRSNHKHNFDRKVLGMCRIRLDTFECVWRVFTGDNGGDWRVCLMLWGLIGVYMVICDVFWESYICSEWLVAANIYLSCYPSLGVNIVLLLALCKREMVWYINQIIYIHYQTPIY